MERGFLRVLGQIAGEAKLLARRSDGDMAKSIHGGRILIKRTRALLWFARPVLAEAALAQAKVQLRNAARILAASRDVAAMQATLKKLAEKGARPRDRKALARLARTVAAPPSAGQSAGKEGLSALPEAMNLLIGTIAEIEKGMAAERAWPSPAKRLERVFHATEQAGKKALRSGKALHFHEWRKKAKRLLYEFELTHAKPDRRTARTMKEVDRLQDTLGAYHDCVVAQYRLRREPLSRAAARRISALLKKRKARLRKRAQKTARSLHARHVKQ